MGASDKNPVSRRGHQSRERSCRPSDRPPPPSDTLGKIDRQLQHCQKMESLGLVSSKIAHDLNNLFFVILGNAELALHELDDASPARPGVLGVVEAAKRAAELAHQMLVYAGRGGFVKEGLDLSAQVGDMASMLKASISKRATFRMRLGKRLPPMEADSAQLRQVVLNLVTNASESLGGGDGLISVTTGSTHCDEAYLATASPSADLRPGVYVYLEVDDTGCGMTPDVLEGLFQPFYSTKTTGRGLGLAAVRSIMLERNGGLIVRSVPGSGTTIRALFPAAAQAELASKPEARPQEGARMGGCVLVVDDEEAVCLIGRQFLEMAGFEVLTACSGHEAIEIYGQRADDIAAVVLDLTMPNMDGDECFRALKRIRSDVRVFLTSGFDERELVRRFGTLGFAGFIQKPYRGAHLVRRVGEIAGYAQPPVQADRASVVPASPQPAREVPRQSHCTPVPDNEGPGPS